MQNRIYYMELLLFFYDQQTPKPLGPSSVHLSFEKIRFLKCLHNYKMIHFIDSYVYET